MKNLMSWDLNQKLTIVSNCFMKGYITGLYFTDVLKLKQKIYKCLII